MESLRLAQGPRFFTCWIVYGIFLKKDIMEEDGGRVFAARWGSFFSQLSYITDSETGPVSKGQTHHHTLLRLCLMNCISEHPAHGGGCVIKPELSSEFTCSQMDLPQTDPWTLFKSRWWGGQTSQLPLPLVVELMTLRTHSMVWCPHLHLAHHTLSHVSEGRFCPRDFAGDKLCLLSESQGRYLNLCCL